MRKLFWNWRDGICAYYPGVNYYTGCYYRIPGTKDSRAKMASMAQVTRDEAYRKLAEEAVSAQQKMAEDQHQMALDIADMKERIAAIEKMLREIE